MDRLCDVARLQLLSDLSSPPVTVPAASAVTQPLSGSPSLHRIPDPPPPPSVPTYPVTSVHNNNKIQPARGAGRKLTPLLYRPLNRSEGYTCCNRWASNIKTILTRGWVDPDCSDPSPETPAPPPPVLPESVRAGGGAARTVGLVTGVTPALMAVVAAGSRVNRGRLALYYVVRSSGGIRTSCVSHRG